MKHCAVAQHEALANARMKRSASFVLNVPKARFIADRRLLFSCAVKRASFCQN
ncbi:MAG: hypothetical protein J6Q89_05385 [Clostridia bacterium]|nr:hypothetical protein [Clostridia bacterium]